MKIAVKGEEEEEREGVLGERNLIPVW